MSFIDDQIKEIDKDIYPFYETFIEEGLSRGQDFSKRDVFIRFSNDIEGIGRSYNRYDHVSDVLINENKWYKNSDVFKEVLIMHELGHAFLGRSHENDCYSVMIENEVCKYSNYMEHREEMLDELFGV